MPGIPRPICTIWHAEELGKTNNTADLKGQNSSEICAPGPTLRSDFNPTLDQLTALHLMAFEHDRDIVSAPIELMELETRHLPGALKLSQEMAWPYRQEDWEFALMVGNGLVLERAGQVIGTAMSWNYGQSYASVGMIIVTSSAQGGGNGTRLFDGLLETTHGRNLLLNSTEQGLALYKRRGFTAWGTVLQHQGSLAVAVTRSTRDDIRQATTSDLAAIQAFDERATGMPRLAMVAALADVGNALVIERRGRIAGYAVARRFGRGYVVGPCGAESDHDARLLILAQLSKLHNQFVRIDVYAEDGLGDWLASLGLQRSGTATAMVKGQRPVAEGPAHMYALANQSFT
ncbi:GNAT family N-acetyltransferase [Mesorhizobium sp. LMG 17147]|uniref:GNAT family N-acetyltransferase n=1 Tax=Mesorhizobium sp. LMG 17147 TaxID=2963091 RepID=UPI0020C97735|nr:GNAT family N-acetyltransferase [Mesorhizobium sp. LMG 17147]